jgi:hypothetical protein
VNTQPRSLKPLVEYTRIRGEIRIGERLWVDVLWHPGVRGYGTVFTSTVVRIEGESFETLYSRYKPVSDPDSIKQETKETEHA